MPVEDAVLIAARTTLVVVFATAAVAKLRGRSVFKEFVGSLEELDLVRRSPVAVLVLAYLIVGTEVVATAALISTDLAEVGLIVTTLLLVVFSGVTLREVWRGGSARCICFGSDGGPLGGAHLVRNLGLLSIAAVGLILELVGVKTGFHDAAGSFDAVAAGALLGIVAVHTDDVVFLLPPRVPHRRWS